MLTKGEITLVRSLGDKRGRVEHGLFVVEGRKMVSEAVRSGWEVKRVYTTEQDAEYGSCPVTLTGPAQFERISRLKSPQGVLALVAIPYNDKADIRKGQLVLALDSVQDPGNLGTIIRIADWFGIADILCGGDTADCFNPKVVQATMGSLFRVRLHYGGLSAYLETAAKDNIPVHGAFLNGADIYSGGFEPSGILVMGNEGNGISDEVGGYITSRISIPSFASGKGGAESLNVAVATAVIVSEFRRSLAAGLNNIRE